MTEDDIIRMAREVGAGEPESLFGRTDYVVMTRYDLDRFAARIAAAEREACAQLCDDLVRGYWNSTGDEDEPDAYNCAAAIRERSYK